jgi:uncharacterized protein (DUF1800 family)
MKKKLVNIFLLSAIVLTGCGGQENFDFANLKGQVISVMKGSSVNHYAASRFLDQASMGPSPSSVAQIKAQGIDKWISTQLILPPTKIITPDNLPNYDPNLDKPAAQRMYDFYRLNLYNFFVGGEDQLRIRTSWVLSNFLVVSERKVNPYGTLEYLNLLQANAFGQYGDLLRALIRSPSMGYYLDSIGNSRYQLNENFGRELMQLFSIGLIQLNLDGTPKRDINGKILETYNQKDVIEITRALTSWIPAPSEKKLPNGNHANFGKQMVEHPCCHDPDAKSFLGRTIPAGQDAYKDMESIVEILVNHPNTAPFVSMRLIQGMTTSDPSPAYLKRVATVFKDTNGNLGKVVTAILTDPEARNSDSSSNFVAKFGRIKEPFLIYTSGFRGLGCKLAVRRTDQPEQVHQSLSQQPFYAYSVFNFYPPNHRTQGTNILAPEQKMLTSIEFARRMSFFYSAFEDESALNEAGCEVTTFKTAQNESLDKLIALMNERFFRGALPSNVAVSIKESLGDYKQWNKGLRITGSILDMASITPAFGVSE